MKIAVSGTHSSGKTTLVEGLHRALSGFELFAEPYWILVDEGYEFSAMPSLVEFELQLERSIDLIAVNKQNCIYDRCPIDLLAYLLTHRDSAGFDPDLWLKRVRDAMDLLDLVVFVPIEDPDRIDFSDPDDNLRERVDEEIRELLAGGRFDIENELVEVAGTLEERLRQVLEVVARLGQNRRPGA